MPGPPLAARFAYDGTPYPLHRSAAFNTLSREMIQTQRFYNSKSTGTYMRPVSYKNIPQNSDLGRGANSGSTIVETTPLTE